MNQATRRRKTVQISAWLLFVVIWLVSSTIAAIHPAKITGADSCTECHKSEFTAWQETAHFKSFRTLHRSKEAKEMAKKLGIRRVKSEALCQTCHYTTQDAGGRIRATAGISCESCHGAAKEWLDLHHDYGGKEVTRETETPEHKNMRLEETAKFGMIRPDQPYLVAENCYQCHTVPNEKLVNEGEHPAGSAFELVSWLQGEVRHNFFITDGKENREAPSDLDAANHKRVLYVIGQMLDLEYSLRAQAVATQPGNYADAMSQRVTAAMDKLTEIQSQSGNASLDAIIKEMLESAGKAKLEPNNEAELMAAADAVKVAAQKFTTDFDGSKLAALDSLIPGKDQYKGKPYE